MAHLVFVCSYSPFLDARFRVVVDAAEYSFYIIFAPEIKKGRFIIKDKS